MLKYVSPGDLMIVRGGYEPIIWSDSDSSAIAVTLAAGDMCIVIATERSALRSFVLGTNTVGWCVFDERWEHVR